LFLPLVWPSAVWAGTGATNARRLAVPLLYFYFAVPLWDAFNTPLQRLTVSVVSAWLRAAAIPAYIDGNFIHLPNGTFEVAGGCSGLHFVVAGLALAALAGLLHHERWRERALLAAAALVASVVANWLRVYTVVVAGYLSDMQNYLVAKNHYYFGWALFVVCWLPVMILDRRLQRSAAAGAASSRATAQAGSAPSGASADPTATRRAAFVPHVGAALAVVVLGAGIWISFALEAPPVVARPATADLPVVAGWRELGEWSDERRPVFVGATTETSGRYVRDGLEVAVFIARYAAQGQDHEVVYYANRPEGEGAEIVSRATVDGPGRDAPFAELEVADRGGGRRLVRLGLRVAGRPAVGQIQAKLLQAAGVLRGRRDAEALVLSASCAEDCGRARAALDEFARGAADLLY
jgi:EpsI family protein